MPNGVRGYFSHHRGLTCVVTGITEPYTAKPELKGRHDMYGADGQTRQRLRRLPLRDRPFRNLQDVVTALDAVRPAHA
jgi:hypothetical protein